MAKQPPPRRSSTQPAGEAPAAKPSAARPARPKKPGKPRDSATLPLAPSARPPLPPPLPAPARVEDPALEPTSGFRCQSCGAVHAVTPLVAPPAPPLEKHETESATALLEAPPAPPVLNERAAAECAAAVPAADIVETACSADIPAGEEAEPTATPVPPPPPAAGGESEGEAPLAKRSAWRMPATAAPPRQIESPPPVESSAPHPAMAEVAIGGGQATQPDQPEEETQAAVGLPALSSMPSWMISLVAHLVILMVLALVSFSISQAPERLSLELGEGTEPEEIEQFRMQEIENTETPTEEETPAELTPLLEKLAEVPLDVAVTEPTAAPQAVTLDPLGDAAAPDNDYSRDLGTYSGTGLSGRGQMSGEALAAAGGSPGSEKAVAAALAWLAAHQNPDGSWGWDHENGLCQGRCGQPGSHSGRNGSTGMALLPFLGAGHTHEEGDYRETVYRALAYLGNSMQVSGGAGDLRDDGNMYSHGLCAIALSEAYAMTQDRRLYQHAQAAINYIVQVQDPVGGGWRYGPRQAGDTSVVGWQLMALKSAHLAYLDVPPNAVVGASHFLDQVQAESGARYGYASPGGGEATTAIGLLCRMYLGWKHDHPALERGVEFLAETGPSPNNLYYNYYATQVMHHFGGEEWEAWNAVMRDQLVDSQSQEDHTTGSWFIGGGIGSSHGGRLYCTCMSTMILEVYYRHMPLYGNQAAEEDFPL